VNKGLPSTEQAIALLQKHGTPPKVIQHSKAVAAIALDLASQLQKNGCKINLQLVEAGALLHDLGRSKSHNVDHGLVGAQIAKTEGLPESLVNVIKCHVGGGITSEEAERFGWPKDSYMPQSLEEKVVCYADKLVDKGERVSISFEIQRLSVEHREAAERVRNLHEQITRLLGN
jgi:uncharacterized protein